MLGITKPAFGLNQRDDTLCDGDEHRISSDWEGPNITTAFSASCLEHRVDILRQARAIFDQGGKVRVLVEAMILANQNVEEISVATGFPSEVVLAFESRYFDIRGGLGAPDWISITAVPCDYETEVRQEFALCLKRFAYFRGPVALSTAKPYLLCGQKLLENMETTTPEDRTRLIIELAIAAELVPEHGRRQHSPVLSVYSFMREMDSQQFSRAVPMRTLADNARLLLEEWSRDLVWKPPQQPAKVSAPQEPAKTRQVARAG